MYIAAMRIADDFGCDLIGIQYQQGLKDLLPRERPGRGHAEQQPPPAGEKPATANALYKVSPAHFNEVDECAGLDGLMTYRVHKSMGQPVENTLHDLRWGDHDQSGTVDDYVWVFLIRAPPRRRTTSAMAGRAARASASPICTSLGGGSTLKGHRQARRDRLVAHLHREQKLRMDLGRAGVVKLPREETERRWRLTTPQWPIMHAVTYGVSRDQMMARHKANHIQCAYADTPRDADKALLTKAAMAEALGMEVAICGTKADGSSWT